MRSTLIYLAIVALLAGVVVYNHLDRTGSQAAEVAADRATLQSEAAKAAR